ncbi:DUF3017 domain-containing protein [Streptomyces sp. NPDC086091]|uniref:DUF3017 domain-containing protein n=1 Tax=Streptomyces sp. NPDC086091 TaxID=3365751 RepID=UPI00380835C5
MPADRRDDPADPTRTTPTTRPEETSGGAPQEVSGADPEKSTKGTASTTASTTEPTPDADPDGADAPAADATSAPTPPPATKEAAFVEPVVTDAVSAPGADGVPRRTTRRFPLFTRDTARPEGGGRAAPGDAPAPARQWPILAVLGLVALGLLITALDQFRIGIILIGVALLGGAVLRWLLPGVGMLAVRSRFTDIATYGVLGAVIVLLALMAQPKPLLQIPFLKDTLHFTVDS